MFFLRLACTCEETWDVTKTGNGKQGMGNGKLKMGNEEWEIEMGN